MHAIGIRNELLDWFKDYLKHRKQAVTIKGETSSYLEIQAGVPQGSVLGPTLFLIFINDIVSDIVSTIKLFADDTSIYLSLNDAHMRTVILNDDMRKISNWAKKWKVDFNPDKSKLMTITNKQSPETQQLEFCGTQLNESIEHKHLGVILRNDCKWNSHINSIIEKTRIQIACLRSHKYKLGRRTLEIMYKSFILPHFDYADFLWDNCSETLSDELEKLNLDAIRTITGAVRGTSHHKLYEESGILPLKERRRRHKLIMYYKLISGLTPNYLKDSLPPLVSDINPYHRRNPLERYTPRCRLSLYQDSFFPSTTAAWNNLPDKIKTISSASQFKQQLAINDVRVPTYYYCFDRIAEIIHCKIRLEMSDLKGDLFKRHLTDDKTCDCGFFEENARHYFFDCTKYIEARNATIHSNQILNNTDLRTLTHGKQNLSIQENMHIFRTVQEFIKKSNRFGNYYTGEHEETPN